MANRITKDARKLMQMAHLFYNCLDAVSGAYWCLMAAIYLGWSFWTMRWDFTWIVWPVAGVLFAAISGIAKAIVKVDES